jgi:ankyrin repeat protein
MNAIPEGPFLDVFLRALDAKSLYFVSLTNTRYNELVHRYLELNDFFLRDVTGKDGKLYRAIEKDKEGFVRFLLLARPDLERHTYDDNSVVVAARNGNANIVRMLLDAGADVHAQNDKALRMSAKEGHIDVVRFLLQAGADVHANNDKALMHAVQFQYKEIVQMLLSAGADVHNNSDQVLNSALRGHKDIVLLLLNAGADVSKIDFDSTFASPQAFSALLRHGIDTREKANNMLLNVCGDDDPYEDVFGPSMHTPQDVKVAWGALRAGADIHKRDPTCMVNKHLKIVDKLAYNAYFAHGDKDTALVFACARRQMNFVRKLLLRGADPRAKKDAALFEACRQQNKKMLKTLLNACPQTSNILHGKLLRFAVQKGENEHIVEYLLEKGTTSTSRGKALEHASEKGFVVVVDILLASVNKGALNASLVVACHFGQLEVVKKLLRAGAAKSKAWKQRALVATWERCKGHRRFAPRHDKCYEKIQRILKASL